MTADQKAHKFGITPPKERLSANGMNIKEKSHAFAAKNSGSGKTVKEKNLSVSGLNAKEKFEQFGVVPPNHAVTSKTGLSPAQKLAQFGTKAEHYQGNKTKTLTPAEKLKEKYGIYKTPDMKNLSVTGLTAEQKAERFGAISKE